MNILIVILKCEKYSSFLPNKFM